MTPNDLKRFQERMGWNRRVLGDILDISQDRLRRFFDGRSNIPNHIALACYALEVMRERGEL